MMLPKARGLDVSDNQDPARLRLADWRALGFCYLFYQTSRGLTPTPRAAAHRVAARLAGYFTGPYMELQGWKDAPAQARLLVASRGATDELPDMVAVELQLTEPQLRAFCDEHDGSGVDLAIYTGFGVWERIVPVAARARYAKYKLVFGGYPFDAPEGPAGQPMDAASVARRSTPPATAQPLIPPPWTAYWSWQHTGHGRLPGYDGDLDLEVSAMTEAELRASLAAPVPTLTQTRGCLIGGHAQSTSSIVPLFRKLKPAIILADENPGLCVDLRDFVPTRIARFHHPETGDDHDFEAGGAGRGQWSADKRLRFARASINLPFAHMAPTEGAAVTHVQCLGNEWDAQYWGEWIQTLDVLALAADERDNRQAEYVRKYGRPLRLALPIFNAGTPKTWDMYLALADHPIWARMHAAGDVLVGHEGIAFDQPFTWGEGESIDPAAPLLAGAGTVNFRIDYLLSLLWARGIKLNYAVTEWYDGRRGRAAEIEARVDNLIRHDLKLAHEGGPWRAYCLGYCCFELTDDPGSPWYAQDFTAIWQHPRWQAHVLSQAGRVNGTGATIMPITTKEKQSMHDAATVLRAGADGLLAQIDAIVVDDGPAPHTWRAGDVARALANPLQLYDGLDGQPRGAPRANYTSDINVLAVSVDGQWLQVLARPEYWVRAADVTLKV